MASKFFASQAWRVFLIFLSSFWTPFALPQMRFFENGTILEEWSEDEPKRQIRYIITGRVGAGYTVKRMPMIGDRIPLSYSAPTERHRFSEHRLHLYLEMRQSQDKIKIYPPPTANQFYSAGTRFDTEKEGLDSTWIYGSDSRPGLSEKSLPQLRGKITVLPTPPELESSGIALVENNGNFYYTYRSNLNKLANYQIDESPYGHNEKVAIDLYSLFVNIPAVLPDDEGGGRVLEIEQKGKKNLFLIEVADPSITCPPLDGIDPKDVVKVNVVSIEERYNAETKTVDQGLERSPLYPYTLCTPRSNLAFINDNGHRDQIYTQAIILEPNPEHQSTEDENLDEFAQDQKEFFDHLRRVPRENPLANIRDASEPIKGEDSDEGAHAYRLVSAAPEGRALPPPTPNIHYEDGIPVIEIIGKVKERVDRFDPDSFFRYEQRETVRITEADLQALNGAGAHLKPGLYWIDGVYGGEGKTVLRHVPKTGDPSALYIVDTDALEKKSEEYRETSEVLKDFVTRSGAIIPEGSVVFENSHDRAADGFVHVALMNDPSGTVYSLSKKEFMNLENTRPLRQSSLEYLTEKPAIQRTLQKTYQIGENPIVDVPSLQGDRTITVPAHSEVIDLGPHNNWARRVQIAGRNGVFIVGKRTLANASIAVQEGSAASLELSDSRPVEEPTIDPNLHDPTPPQEPSISPTTREGHYGNVRIDYSRRPEDCNKRNDKYHREKALSSWSKRSQYRDTILEAANDPAIGKGIHPAILEASIQLESDFQPQLENGPEKKKYTNADGSLRTPPMNGDEWGKGLCQFGPSYAAQSKLTWLGRPPPLSVINSYSGQYPRTVWNPHACILEKAKQMRAHSERIQTLQLDDGSRVNMVEFMYNRPGVSEEERFAEQARYVLGYYNRGNRMFESMKAHYKRNGSLPGFYGTNWSTVRLSDQAVGSVLKGQNINRGHIYRAAGLCGPIREASLIGRLRKEYKKVNGRWVTNDEHIQ